MKPLLGHFKAGDTRADIDTFKRDVVLGKTAKDQKLGFRKRSIVKGGKGVVTRTIGMLGAVFAWGQENGFVENNPVRGVKRFRRQAEESPADRRAVSMAGACAGSARHQA